MNENFLVSLHEVLKDEGGNDDDPRDHGGRTSRGITQREYNARFTGDVWQATDEQVKTIYYDQYWEPYCPSIPSGLDYLFFDISVNAGRTQAVKQFQKALGINPDGMFGLETRQAIASVDPAVLIHRVCEARRSFYRHLKQFSIYGRGWLSRVDHSERVATNMVNGVHGHTAPADPHPKATEPTTTTMSPGTTGTAAGGLIAILASFKADIEGLTSFIPNLNYVMLSIAVIGLGYMLWSTYQRKQIAQAVD